MKPIVNNIEIVDKEGFKFISEKFNIIEYINLDNQDSDSSLFVNYTSKKEFRGFS